MKSYLLIIHVLAGAISLLAGALALGIVKKSKPHKKMGKIFFYSMSVVFVTAIILSTIKWQPFLLLIGIFSYAGTIRGIRSMQMIKTLSATSFDTIFSVVWAIVSLVMIGLGVYYYIEQEFLVGTLVMVFGILSLLNARSWHKLLHQKLSYPILFSSHVSGMALAYIASLTAFFVNTITILPWYVVWFLPTLIFGYLFKMIADNYTKTKPGIFTKAIAGMMLLALSLNSQAQEITNTVRGTVMDKISKTVLQGSTISVSSNAKNYATSSNENGEYKLSGIPIGRYTVKITSLGYETIYMDNIEITSGKELILNIELTEELKHLEEVTVTAGSRKNIANNSMASISARQFTIDESQRYAGSRNDVARMATNYAGVRAANDAVNDIVIRGNSSYGLLWRLEGVDIPNPNHYGDGGATGGPVSMLNSNVMSNSDFFTSAFPAEYGNAISGVFDLKMRNGNNEKHEFLGMIGFNGFEIGAEGPIHKKSRASYLINYRLSTLEVMQKAGLNFGTGTAVPKYQDISFKVNFPKTKAGSFKVFGVGGTSDIKLMGSETDTTQSESLYGTSSLDIRDFNKTGVIGLTNRFNLSANRSIEQTVSYSAIFNGENIDTVDLNTRKPCNCEWIINRRTNSRAGYSFIYKEKVNASFNWKAGVFVNRLSFDLKEKLLVKNQYVNVSNVDGYTWMAQPYVQAQYKPGYRLTINPGIAFQWLALNQKTAVLPRIGINYKVNEKGMLKAGYGLHVLNNPMELLFTKKEINGEYIAVNENLGFIKSHHGVIGYDYNIKPKLRLMVETYFQLLADVPVSKIPSAVSLINSGSFGTGFPDSLEVFENTGTGRNYGIEFTLEKFMDKGFYYLATLSLYDSKYKGSDGIWRNTAFNNQYLANGLMGKEFEVKRKKVNKGKLYIVTDTRLALAGGQRYIPLDLKLSTEEKAPRYDLPNSYTKQFNTYFRLDLNLGYKVIGRKTTQEFTIIMQNMTNHKNAFGRIYDPYKNKELTINQLGFFLVPQYRIRF